jgi:hypothetical protein
LTDAAERVVKLYDAWGKPDKAAEWRAKLAEAERLAAAKVASDQKRFAVATEDLVNRIVKSKDRNRIVPSLNELSQRIENGGVDGEAAAQLLLGHGQEITPDPNVKNMLDKLVSAEKSTLAARLLLKIVMAKTAVSSSKTGRVAVGRVVVADGKLDPGLILAQMEILPEGYFASEVGDLERPLVFRAEGYSSLEVPLNGKTEELISLGTVTLEALAAGQAASLQGKVMLKDAKSAETPTVQLSFSVPPRNGATRGVSTGLRFAAPITLTISKSGEFKATGLSPTDHSLNIMAPGYVSQARNFTLKPHETHDAATIALERARQIAISYRVASEPAFAKARTERHTVLGGDRFRPIQQHSGGDLLFVQNDGKISFQAASWRCSIADLGPGKLEDFFSFDPISAKFSASGSIVPRSGHVYLMEQKDMKRWVLFEIEFDEKAPGKGGRP